MEIRADSTVMLNDGRELVTRPVTAADAEAVRAFAAGLSEKQVRCLDQDLTDEAALGRWLDALAGPGYSVLGAFDPAEGQRLAGYCRLRLGTGSHAHSGNIEIFVHPDYTGLGLGSGLVREVSSRAEADDLFMLRAEVPVDDRDKLQALKTLGFELKAIVENWRIDTKGRPYDVIIMVKSLQYPSSQEFLYRY